jgi:transposase
MLGRNTSQPLLFQMVDLEALVPATHRLRKIDRVLDLRFVREAVADLYHESRGRPSIDPELAIRMLLLGALHDLSDRELCEEVALHVGFRWFCRLNLHDPVPDHSTLSKLKEKWSEAGLFEELFDAVLRQCAEVGLVSGRHVSIDGSEVRAHASMKSLAPVEPKPDIAPSAPSELARPKQAQEPEPKGGWSGHGVKYSNQTHRSTTDPEARLFRKGKGKEAKLSYLMHDLLDTKSRVILRRRISPAHSAEEREVAIAMLDEHEQKRDALALAQAVEIASLDAGYGTGDFAVALLERDILPHMPLQAAAEMEEVPTWKRPTYDLAQQRRRREKVKVARARNRVRELQKSRGYALSRRLRLRSEHVFAEAKTCHGMDRSRVRGCRRLQVQADLVATVQNLKRLVSFRGRKRRGAAQAAHVQSLRGTSQHACGPRGRSFVNSRRCHGTTPRLPRCRCPVRLLRKRHSSTDF